MAIDPLTSAFNLGTKIIDKIVPDKAEAERLKLQLLHLQQDGNLKEIEIQISAIIAEAKSADPWTSRARPSFLYVMYAMILMAVPMGVLAAVHPSMAVDIGAGMRAWLGSIPDMLWGIFGTGFLGYTVARSAWDKRAVDQLTAGCGK